MNEVTASLQDAALGPMSRIGALLGLAAGCGLLLVIRRLPWRRTPLLDDRLAPYLDLPPDRRRGAGAGPGRGTAGVVPGGALQQILSPLMADGIRWAERISGGPGTVRRRLDQLGGQLTTEQFRAEQVVWGVLGAVAGAGVALVLATAGAGLVPSAGLVVVGVLLGTLGRDQVLTMQVRRRNDRMLAEFPTVAELLALAVGAGEGAVGALDRVARTCHGELSAELRRTLADARTGASLVQALEGLAARTSIPALARFVDGVTVALERGTPLADVLRAQAQDVRELSRRRLMEAGGKREIAMMIPVVFLILPVTVLFAVYPGLAVLELDL